jgi:thiamine biosynthesis lipoprotein
MGALFSITLYASDEQAARSGADAAFARIAALNDIMSDYQADSELNRLRDQPPGRPVAVSGDLLAVLWRARGFSELSGGAFDVTVGPYVRLWRFARKRKVLPTAGQLAEARAAVGWQKLHLDARGRTVTLLAPGMRLDLGGIAKGYAADEALKLLTARGLDRALVAASGDIAIGNSPPGQRGWKIGINGLDAGTNQFVRTVWLHHAGISTSGDVEQFIEVEGVRYSHILDSRTGLGLTNRVQTTVIARDATTTDAMATSLCILGPRGLELVEKLAAASALMLTREDGRTVMRHSRRFPAP